MYFPCPKSLIPDPTHGFPLILLLSDPYQKYSIWIGKYQDPVLGSNIPDLVQYLSKRSYSKNNFAVK
jgi:hypothetical protein